jgi:hypothetical protein
MHPAAFAGVVVGRITHYALSGTAGVLVLRGAANAAPKAKPVWPVDFWSTASPTASHRGADSGKPPRRPL